MATIQHKLQEFDPGMLWLDNQHRIIALNSIAEQVLGEFQQNLIGTEVLSLHRGQALEKVRFLLEQSAVNGTSAPPMTMMINMPDRLLLIKVSGMNGANGAVGHCMIFYDLTDVATTPAEADSHAQDRHRAGEAQHKRRLFKLPVYKHKQVLLVDMDNISAIKAEGHYSRLLTSDEDFLCNLSLADIEARIESRNFIRVHRSYMVNLQQVKAFEKQDEQVVLVVSGEHRIPVSRSRAQSVKDHLGLG